MPAVPQIEAIRAAQQANSEIEKAQIRLVTATFDQAKAYAHVVLGIGYVSIFAAWGFTREYLTREQIFWSAFLASLSIFVFVLFEVFSMFVTSRTLLKLAEAVRNPARFHEVIAENERKDRALLQSYARSWILCWGFSVVTGVAAALILLGAFVGQLWANH